MYLFAKDAPQVEATYKSPDGTEEVMKWVDEAGVETPLMITQQSAYWRKANHIHAWFVDNVQGGVDDCDGYPVSLEQLAGLVTTCERVLADHSRAAELLPPRSGFFFGSTDFDEWYFKDLEDTIRQLKPLLEPGTGCTEYMYQSSW
jgi:hypothetical protein